MSIIATAVKHLMAAGVTGDALVAAIAEMEAASDTTARLVDQAAEKRRAWDRERKRRQKAERNSTGIPPDPVESGGNAENTPSLNKSPHTPKIKPNPAHNTRTRKATRLEENWTLPTDWREFAKSERGWSDIDIDAEAANFADFWHAKPKDATKLDWQATWRQWVRNSKRPSGKSAGKAKPLASPPVAVPRDGECEISRSIRRLLKDRLGPQTYDGWVKPTAIIVSIEAVTMRCSSDFMANWLQEHHEPEIERACCEAIGRAIDLQFVTVGRPAPPRSASVTPGRRPQLAAPIGDIAKSILAAASA
jgi:hypothetical protein